MSDDAWLADAWSDLLSGPADGRRRQNAARIGARAADNGLQLRDLVDGALRATMARWQAAPAASADTTATIRAEAQVLLTTLRNGDLVCLSAGGLRGISAELAHQLLTELGTGRWQIAVGRTHPGLQGLATSLDEAHNTLEHAARLGFTAPTLNTADLLSSRCCCATATPSPTWSTLSWDR